MRPSVNDPADYGERLDEEMAYSVKLCVFYNPDSQQQLSMITVSNHYFTTAPAVYVVVWIEYSVCY